MKTREFEHYDKSHNSKNHDKDNCGACALLYAGEEGPNYAAWPLSFIVNDIPIPRKYYKALIEETLRDDNIPYRENLLKHLKIGKYEIKRNDLGDYYINGIFVCDEKDLKHETK